MVVNGRTLFYIEVEPGEVVVIEDSVEWSRWMETADRVVARSYVGEGTVTVSTVFLGLDHQWGDGPPLLYETLVFGGPLDGRQLRYPTREEAKLGHDEILWEVMKAQPTSETEALEESGL